MLAWEDEAVERLETCYIYRKVKPLAPLAIGDRNREATW